MHTTNQSQITSKTEERDAAIQISEKKKAGRVKRPPVFKIRAEIIVWREKDEFSLCGGRPTLRVLEELVVTTVPNREDMRSLVMSSVRGRIAHFFGGIDSCDYSLEFEGCEFFAAKSRKYVGSIFEDEPEWVPAVEWLPEGGERDKAIRSLTYLPEDRREQFEIYGA